MTLDEYMEWTDKVAQYPNSDTDLTYPVLKLMGELGEFTVDNTVDEMGDVLWYLARICKATGVSLDYLLANYDAPDADWETLYTNIISTVGQMAEAVGKAIRNGKDYRYRVVMALPGFARSLHALRRGYLGDTFEQIAVANRKKLEARLENSTIKGR